MDPLLSVCVITYNHEKFIRKCLDGIMMQKTNFPFEVVVGEDCSTDGTRAIIREFAEHFPEEIKPVFHTANVGGARNGYEFCYPLLKGKYIAICEGDDYWIDPYKLQKQVTFLEQHPDHSFCFHKVANVDGQGRLLKVDQHSGITVNYKAADIFHISIPTLSVVFRKCFEEIPEEIYQVESGDAFLFGLLARHGKAADLDFLGAHYRTHPGGVFSSRGLVNRYLQCIHTRRVMQEAACFEDDEKMEIGKEISNRKKRYFKQFLKKGQFRNAFRILVS